MTQITIEGIEKLKQTADSIKASRQTIRERVRKELGLLGQSMIRESKESYLSGPRPLRLGVVTGRLRGSIRSMIDEESPDDYTLRFGTDVEYARIHELGGPVIRKGKTIFTMKKRSFLQPSWDENLRGFRLRLPAILKELANTAVSNGQ